MKLICPIIPTVLLSLLIAVLSVLPAQGADTVFSWGYGGGGNLGNNSTNSSNVPVAVLSSGALSGKTVTAISVGPSDGGPAGKVLALTSEGKIYSWGPDYAYWGTGGTGSPGPSTVPVAVNMSGALSGKTVTAVAAGGFSCLALTSEGKVYAWGDNSWGSLGTGGGTSYVPVLVSGPLSGKTVTAIASGMAHSLALTSDGTVYAWGYNGSGGLGNGSTNPSYFPTAVYASGVLAGKTITQIAAGALFSMALDSQGKVYVWGDGNYGQVGNGSGGSSIVPAAVATNGVLSGKTITKIAAGSFHCMAIDSAGLAYAWGRNDVGQLGIGTLGNSVVPAAVNTAGNLAGKTLQSIAAGMNHTLAVDSTGQAYGWGRDLAGCLGLGSGTQSTYNTPQTVLSTGVLAGRKVVSVAAGYDSNGHTSFAVASQPVPVLTSVSPSSGPTAGGTSVTLTGTGFTGTTGVTFGGAAATNVNVASDTSITCTTPAGAAGTASVVVTATYGSNAANTLFTYVAPPTVTSLSPTSGSTAGGTSVTITGTGFTGATGVTIGGAAATSVTVVNDTTITCTTPAGTTGTSSVLVTTPIGTNAANTLFTYFDPPVTATFASAATVPVTSAGYTATGKTVNFTLDFAPTVGTNLTLVSNTARGFISGEFANVANGATVNLTYNNVTYPFVAWYYGGDGNDLVLLWPHTGLTMWGDNSSGQLGDNTQTNRGVPVMVSRGLLAGKTVVQMSRGNVHTLALTTEGKVYSWGFNGQGQLGDGTNTRRLTPVAVSTASGTSALFGKTVVRVAAGHTHSLALCSDGALVAWGLNSSGALGDNSTTDSNVPVLVNTASGTSALFGRTVVSMTAGLNNSFAVCSDGSVAAWGSNSFGKLGDNSTAQRNAPVLVDTSTALNGKTVVSVSAGNNHSAALCSDGTLALWGFNGSGALGNNSTTDSLRPVLVNTASGTSALFGKTVVAVNCTGSATLVLCSDGSAAAWGNNTSGQLGDNSTDQRNAPVLVNTTSGTSALSGKTVVAVAGGEGHSMALCSDGSVAAWGYNVSSQIGDNSTSQRNAPVLVNTTSGVSALAGVPVTALAGQGNSASFSGAIFAWSGAPGIVGISPASGLTTGGTSVTISGYGFTGATGVTIGGAAATNLTVVSDTSITCTTPAGSAGTASVLVTTPSGTNAANTLFTYVAPPPTVASISPSSGSTAGGTSATITGTGFTGATGVTFGGVAATNVTVVNDTTITCTTPAGSGTASVLVTTPAGTNAANSLFTYYDLVASYTSASTVPLTTAGYTATGKTVSLTLNYAPAMGTTLTVVNNTGLGFINGEFSNLANGATVNLTYNSVTYPFVAWYYGGDGNDLVLLWPHTGVAAWGYNASGQLGDSTTIQRNAPVLVDRSGPLGGKTVVQVARGNDFTMALTTEGKVYCWGANAQGQLGDNTNTSRSTPVAVNTASGTSALFGKTVVRVAAGSFHSLALCSDGTVAAWGINSSGQLGNSSSVNVKAPVAVSTASGTSALSGKTVVRVAAGETHSLALCSDGTVAAWGGNTSGQLGNNGTATSNVPAAVNTASGTSALNGKTVTDVAAGNTSSLALCSDGTLAAWGGNTYGQLGDNSNTNRLVPVAVNTASGTSALFGKTVAAIATGNNHCLALCTDGTLTAWGRNSERQVGDNTNTQRLAPVNVNTASGTSALFGKTVVAVAGGSYHSLALCSDGTVAAWGANDWGALGDNTTTSRPAAVAVNTTAGTSVLSGRVVTALATSGRASDFSAATFAWSGAPVLASVSPTRGEIAGGTTLTINGYGFTGATAVTVGGAAATNVTVVNDAQITCTLPAGSEGTASVLVTTPIGTNAANTLFTYFDPLVTATYASAATVPVTASGYTATGRTVNFTLNFAPPVGTSLRVVNNTSPGFISGTFSNLANGAVVNLTYNSVTYPFVAWYYGGDGNDLVLLWPGTSLAMWGFNNAGQVGDSSTTNRSAPVLVPRSSLIGGKTLVQVARGVEHTLALTTEGKVYAWGRNTEGQLGNNTTTASALPVAVVTTGALSGKTVVRLAAGQFHSVALCSDGTIAAWGGNGLGQLGDNTSGTNRLAPVAVNTTSGTSALYNKTATSVSASLYTTLALCSDGTVAAWGYNAYGALGDNSTTSRSAPVAVNTTNGTSALYNKTAIAVAAADYFSLALCSDGTVAAWGYNANGQLGDNSTTNRPAPVAVNTTNGTSALYNKTVTALAAGGNFSLALCSDGTLAAWGYNGNGQLGDNSTTQRTAPVAVVTSGVLSGKTVRQAAAAANYSQALCSDGTLAAWGVNSSGQLGDNTTSQRTTPVLVNTTSGISALAGVPPVSLATSGPTASHSGAVFAVTTAPVLSSVSPASADVAGGATLTLTGYGFTGATAVTVGGTPATNVTVVNDVQITCTLPAGSEGTASVLVTNPYGTNAANTLFTYTAAPTLASVSPTSGTKAGGTAVTLTGTRFTGATSVTFGGTPATNVSVVNATTITCTTPAGAVGAASVLVTTPAGTNAANTLYTYTNTAPALAAISKSGTEDTTVTFTAANFTSSFSDPDNDVLASITVVSLPASGSLKLSGADVAANQVITAANLASLTYVPAANENGAKTFTVTASDGTASSGTATVTMTLAAVSDAPNFALPAGAVTHGGTWTARENSRAWYSIASSADGSKLAASVNGGLIYTSSDSGVTWTAQTGSGSRAWTWIASSADGSKLAAVVSNGQIYTSADSGVSWTARESSRNWFAIASSADGSKLAATVTGGKVYTSSDSGATWTAQGTNHNWFGIASSADGTKLAAAELGGKLYTSTDSGVTWTARDSDRIWIFITSSADGTKLAAIEGDGQIYTSSDSGATWTARQSARAWNGITSSADGTQLAAVVNNGQIYLSSDGGLTWTAKESNRPWRGIASSADGSKLVASVVGGQIYTSAGTALPYTLTVTEDAGAQSVPGFASAISPGPADESAQTVTFTVSNNNNALFASQPALSSAGTLTFASAANAYGTATVSVTAVDNGGTANGGVDTSSTQTFTLTVTPANDPPADITLTPASIAENNNPGATVGTLAALGDPDVGATHTFSLVSGSGSTDNGSFTIAGTSLKLTPAADFETQSTYSVRVQADDGAGGTFAKALTVTITDVNDAPVLAPVNVSGTEDTTLAFAAADFISSYRDDDGTSLASITVVSLPAAGTLQLFGSDISASEVIDAADLGELTYVPAANENGAKTFTVTASDGAASSSPATTVTMTLAAVNDSPTLDGAAGTTWAARDSSRSWSSVAVSADGTKLVAGVRGGQLYTSTDSGSTWTARDSNRDWIHVAGSADGTKLVALNQNHPSGGGLYTSSDSGATWTLRSGAGTRVWTKAASSADGTKLVAAAYNGPLLTSDDSGATWTTRETSRLWFAVASSADGTKLAAAVQGGGLYTSTDSGATWTLRSSAGTRDYKSIASSADGTKLVACAFGSQIITSADSGATWTTRETARSWCSVDSSADGVNLLAGVSGGRLYTSSDSGVTWTASESNRSWAGVGMASGSATMAAAPSGSNIYVSRASLTPLQIAEDAATQTVNLTGITSGAANESQVLTVTASSSDPAVIPNPSVTYTSPSATGTLSFAPVANASGTATITVTNTDDNTAGGAALAISRTFTVTVTPVNDAPGDITLTPSSIAENNAANATVGTLAAVDPDIGDSHTFTLVSGTGDTDNGSFTISGSTLRLTPRADYETKNSYSVRVQADDGVGGVFEKALDIAISDVDDNNANLASLVLSAGTLSPAFSGSTTAYTATVTSTTSSLSITPTAAASYGVIAVGVNGGAYAAATSGQAATITLGYGVNTIAVRVTALDGTTIKTYVVAVTREGITPEFLGSSGSAGTGTGTGAIEAPNETGSTSIGVWESLRSGAVQAANGTMAFRGHMEIGSGSTPVSVSDFQGIWKHDNTGTRLLARSGGTAPQADGAVFDMLPVNPFVSANGLVTFFGTLRMGTGSPPVTSANNMGLWSEQGDGSVALLAREGDVIPGTTGNQTLSNWLVVASSNANTLTMNPKLSVGSALLHFDLNTPGTTQVTVMAEEGSPAPGGGVWGALYYNQSDPRMNSAGDVAFLGWEKISGTLRQGIYTRRASIAPGTSGVVLEALVGNVAPGTSSATFAAFERPTIYNGGLAYRGFLSSNGDNAAGNRNQGIWAGPFGAQVPIVRTGDTNAQIPSIRAGSVVSSIWSPFSSESGALAFRVSLFGGPSERRAIMGSTGGTLRVIADSGDATPGLAGDTFLNFDHPVIGDGDQIVFTASTAGGGYGIWKEAPGGGALSLVMKVGDQINTATGLKTVTDFIMPGITTDDRKYESKCVDDDGNLLIHVVFDDGTTSLLMGN